MQVKLLGQIARAVVTVALTATALVAVATGPASAAAPCQRTFTSTGSAPISPAMFIPMPPDPVPFILPGLGVSAGVEVAAGAVADVEVAVHITHPSADQLTLSVGNGFTSVTLKSAGGAPGADFAGTTFDDEAAQAVTSGAPPYNGRFRPAQALTAYDGTLGAGPWALAANNYSLLPGTIDSWAVTITYATCDLDADAVEDHGDSCQGVTANTASGCPLTTRSLTAKYRHGRFKGALSSPVSGCEASRSVTVWKKRSGPDRAIGSATTRSDGSYKLKRAKHRGRYYATSSRVAVVGLAECPAVQSPTFKIR